MAGVENPFDKITSKIEMSQHDKSGEYTIIKDDTNVADSPHKNFDKIFNSMSHIGDGSLSDSTIHEEKERMGENLKAMGQAEDSRHGQSVRKEDTKMGERMKGGG
jgi:hypothetical protein